MPAPRLKDFDYVGYAAYSITICCDFKRKFFESDKVVQKCISFLKECSDKYQFKIYLYTFMPNHLHLCVVGDSDNANLKKMIIVFKQKCSFWFKKECNLKLFQQGYYDHIIRKEEGIGKVMNYIAYNPIRKNLCENYCDYKFTGSFEFELSESFFY